MTTQDELVRCRWVESHPLLREYHDHGHISRDDCSLFEHLMLEMFRS